MPVRSCQAFYDTASRDGNSSNGEEVNGGACLNSLNVYAWAIRWNIDANLIGRVDVLNAETRRTSWQRGCAGGCTAATLPNKEK